MGIKEEIYRDMGIKTSIREYNFLNRDSEKMDLVSRDRILGECYHNKNIDMSPVTSNIDKSLDSSITLRNKLIGITK